MVVKPADEGVVAVDGVALRLGVIVEVPREQLHEHRVTVCNRYTYIFYLIKYFYYYYLYILLLYLYISIMINAFSF